MNAARVPSGSRQYSLITAGERRHTWPDLACGHRAIVVVEQREIDGRVRAADADDGVFLGIVERGSEADACFRTRVASREQCAEPPAGFFGESGSDRPTAGDDEAQRGQVVVVEVGLAEHQREL